MARYGQSLLQGWEAGLDTSTELLSSEILTSPPVYSCPVLGETLEKSGFSFGSFHCLQIRLGNSLSCLYQLAELQGQENSLG